jgi:hypothetical protein
MIGLLLPGLDLHMMIRKINCAKMQNNRNAYKMYDSQGPILNFECNETFH